VITSVRYNINEPARAKMLALAESLHFPRISRQGIVPSDSRIGWLGPGPTAWYLFAEQFPASDIEEATRALSTTAPTPAAAPEAAQSADVLIEAGGQPS